MKITLNSNSITVIGEMAVKLMLTVRGLIGERRRAKVDKILATDFERRRNTWV